MMRFYVHLCLFLACLPATILLASPAQRLIIQLDTALNAKQAQHMQKQIKSIIPSEFSILPYSTDQRWIIVITPALNESDLTKVNAEISRLKYVKYVELDQVMTKHKPSH